MPQGAERIEDIRGKDTYPTESDMKSSPAAYRAHIAFGNGARTYVATTSRGSQFAKRAHDKITRRNPHARTNDRPMMLLLVLMAEESTF
jgi:hypothetical protein